MLALASTFRTNRSVRTVANEHTGREVPETILDDVCAVRIGQIVTEGYGINLIGVIRLRTYDSQQRQPVSRYAYPLCGSVCRVQELSHWVHSRVCCLVVSGILLSGSLESTPDFNFSQNQSGVHSNYQKCSYTSSGVDEPKPSASIKSSTNGAPFTHGSTCLRNFNTPSQSRL